MDKLGIVAGSGRLPLELIEHCRESGIESFCVLLKSFANPADYADLNFVELGIGQVGKLMNFFWQNGVSKLVLLGGAKKPSLRFLRMDAKGAILAKNILKNRVMGDNSILEVVVKFLEEHGFQVLEIDSLLDNLKLHIGPNNSVKCGPEYLEDIEIGCNVLRRLSEFDLGQAVAVQQRNIVAVECSEGTAGLIQRVGELRFFPGSGPVLVKIGKVSQTRKADLPSIGPNTIEQLHQNGFAGAALDSKNCLVISRSDTIRIATKYNLFLYGIDI
ncbi:MAG: UDP-2,3-diacylglucosamine diphosphatase LpxI [Rickettsiales bacterium]|nr:UDP-2,3-diacylglucosamine diphosphatase LpxI [Rickettsiales bacterium]